MKQAAVFFFYFTFSHLYASEMDALLFHGNCTTCHFELEDKSAPSMLKVRAQYLQAFPKKEDFVKYMSAWVANPSEETSIMLEAVKKYTLMPHLAFEKDTLQDISSYIYDTDFTKEHLKHK